MRIRPATPFDLDEIVALDTASFPDQPWPPGALQSLLDSEQGLHLLIEGQRAGIQGYLLGTHLFDIAEIERIAVAPKARHRGLGQALLAAFFGEASHRGALRVHLEVREDNHPAMKLYQGAHFTIAGRRAAYYKDGTSALLLTRALRPEDQKPDPNFTG